AGAQQRDERGAGRQRLQAAAVAAAADRPGLVDGHVADLAGHAASAVIRAPVDDQPGADTGRDLHITGMTGVAAGAQRHLGERARVGVVVDVDGEPEAAAELRAGIDPGPAGQDRAGVDGAARLVDRAGDRDADAEHALAAGAGLLERAVDEPGRDVERADRVV